MPLFGTDGVRGPVDGFLTPQLVADLSAAATEVLSVQSPRVLVIRDTRESGPALAEAVACGVAKNGGTALMAGVLPTPAAPLLIKRYGFDLGVVISASHNPYADNGVKFFQADGFKLNDQLELQIEQHLHSSKETVQLTEGEGEPLHNALEDYLRELQLRFGDLNLTGLKLALDCANGATFQAAPEIFTRLGAEVTTFANTPNGRNINEGCGSTHLEGFAQTVAEGQFDLGFSFDGDGDRLMAIDGSGTTIDGDGLIALAAKKLHDSGKLEGGVVVTVMTNYGFHLAMDRLKIPVATTDVGDRYVLQELRKSGWKLGGEQSGHIIQMDFVPSGDGIASALMTLEVLAGRSLEQSAVMQRLPQRLVNVPINDKGVVGSSPLLQESVKIAETTLKGRGRVLVRPSGTEQLIRVMVEAPTDAEASSVCDQIVQVVKQIEKA